MIQNVDLKLIYFKMRALAEPPQLLLSYAGVDYKYLMSWEYFKQPWAQVKSSIVFSQLPLLIVNNDNQIAQSGSIIRYLAKITDMLPKDDILAAKADAIFESAHEMFFPLNPTINFAVGPAFEKAKIIIIENSIGKLTDFENILNETSSGSFFLGKTPFYCDFGVYHHLSLLRILNSKILDKYPKVDNFMHEMEAIENIQKYLNNRPELIGIGNKPQLVINGIKCNTGVTIDK